MQAQLASSAEMRELGIYFAIVTLDPEKEMEDRVPPEIAVNMTLEAAARLLKAEFELLQSGTPCSYQQIKPQSDSVS